MSRKVSRGGRQEVKREGERERVRHVGRGVTWEMMTGRECWRREALGVREASLGLMLIKMIHSDIFSIHIQIPAAGVNIASRMNHQHFSSEVERSECGSE